MKIFKGLSGKFLIPYGLTFLFGFVTLWSVDYIRKNEQEKDQYQQLKIDLLTLRKEEKDFIAREYKNQRFIENGDSKYLSRFNSLAGSTQAKLDLLSLDYQLDPMLKDSLQLLVGEYAFLVNQLASSIREKGFKDHGLVGDLRDAIHEVEDADVAYDRYYLLMLRRHEKDFFLRNDLSYWTKFQLGMDDFVDHINTQSNIASSQKERILSKLDFYQSAFKQTVEIQQTIGLSETSGLHGQLRDKAHQLTPVIDRLIVESNERTEAGVRFAYTLMMISFVIIVLIGIYILHRHVNKITRNINIIKSTAVELSKGHLPDEHAINTKDELGRAHEAINKLTGSLRERAAFAAEIGNGNLKANFQLLSTNDPLGESLLKMRDHLDEVLSEVQIAVHAASKDGRFSVKINDKGKEGVWKILTRSINTLLDSMSAPLIRVNEVVSQMANGNLDSEMKGEFAGEVAALSQDVNRALSSLNGLISEIQVQSKRIDSYTEEMDASGKEMSVNTGEIASSISQISSGAQRQVQKVDEVSKQLESILTSARSVAELAELIHLASSQGYDNSKNGLHLVETVTEGLAEMSTSSNETMQAMDQMLSRSQEIMYALSVISDIAAQTNMLSLNAAIEAAQAGESGKGFSVVSEEIRKLADESKEAAINIGRIVENVVTDSKKSSSAMNELNQSVNKSLQVGKEALSTFNSISGTAKETLNLAEEIKQLTEKQSSNVNEILSLSESVVVISEETATATEQVAASASELAAGMDNHAGNVSELSQIANLLHSNASRFSLRKKDSSREQELSTVD